MRPVLLVHGTWGADFGKVGAPREWWEPGSAFAQMLATNGLDASVFDRFIWSGDVNGINRLYPWNWFKHDPERDWRAGGRAVTYLLAPRECPSPFASRNVIAHSHGGQVMFFAAAAGLKVRRLITVSTPVRADMLPIIKAARPNIEEWWHLYDPTLKDRIQLLGEIGDRRLGFVRTFADADRNVSIAGAGHSGVLTQPEWFRVWNTRGLIDFFGDAKATPYRAA